MPDAARRKRAPRREVRVSRTYRLPLSKLRAAKRALGAATATETIERALDLAVFSANLSPERGRCSGSRSLPQMLNGDSHLAQVRSRYSTLHQRLFAIRFVNQELQRFHRARKALERNVLKIFQRANRTITPSADAWHRSGDVLAEIAREEGLEIPRVSKSFANDVLLALSCREAGCVLITDNQRDFNGFGD